MHIQDTILPGVKILQLPSFEDNRGRFTKTFHSSTFDNESISFELKESYYSLSNKGVIRGMHFQLPPYDHSKIVYCPYGEIVDTILDIRKNSPTYGQYIDVLLSGDNHQAVYIPKGCAHGFESLQDGSITQYLVSSEHHGPADTGILYNSFGKIWINPEPIMSSRDLTFQSLDTFQSPFEY